MTGSHISLFAGVGMTDIAVEAAGFKTIATAESDPFCREVLRVRFPDAHHFGTVGNIIYDDGGWEKAITPPLMISGGFPCQGIAASGLAKGISDPRSALWGEFARIIYEFRPEYVLIENSPLLRSRGLDRILSDLADLEYDARWDCIPAAAVGAPHLRDRIFVVAVPSKSAEGHQYPERIAGYMGFAVTSGCWVPDRPESTGRITKFPRAGRMVQGWLIEEQPRFPLKGLRAKSPLLPTPTRSDGTGGPGVTPKRTGGKNLRTVAAEREGNGRLNPLYVEWMMGLPRGWTDPRGGIGPHFGWGCGARDESNVMTTGNGEPLRSKRIRALGNGVVPQVVDRALTMLFDFERELV